MNKYIIFIFLSCYLFAPLVSAENDPLNGPYEGGFFYPHHYRTSKLLCDPLSVPRAEEICLRPCKSDNDCIYRSADVILPPEASALGLNEDQYLTFAYQFSSARGFTGSMKKPKFLAWTCQRNLGYCTPYNDDQSCNYGWRRVPIEGAVSLTMEKKIGTFDVIDQFRKVSYMRNIRDMVHIEYLTHLLVNDSISQILDIKYFTSYMCQCDPDPVYNPCNGNPCSYLGQTRGNDYIYQSTIHSEIVKIGMESVDNNVQFKTAPKVTTGFLFHSSPVKLLNKYNYIAATGTQSLYEQLRFSIAYTYCECEAGLTEFYQGTSCNNLIDNCGLLYCGNKGLCARDIVSSQSTIQSIYLSQPGVKEWFIPSFVYSYEFPSSLYWMKDIQRSVTLTITNYAAPQMSNQLSLSNCFCEYAMITFNPTFLSSNPNAVLPNPDGNNQNPNGCYMVEFNYLCCDNKGTWPNSGDSQLATFSNTCIQKFGGTGMLKPCNGAECYGFNCELTCNQLCSGHASNPITSCYKPQDFSDPDARLNNLCMSCQEGYGPPALSGTWRAQVSQEYKIYSSSLRFCNLIYSKPYDQPNEEAKECGGYGYSINLDKAASILGLNRSLIGVIRRSTSMEINFDPAVLIRSYQQVAYAYIDGDNEPRFITEHPAFAGVIISEDSWKNYVYYYYRENVGTRCECADGFIANDIGTCILNSCGEWTTIHPTDKSGLVPNGLTCGGFARSYSGCLETPQKKSCTCREGFAGISCEQVLCAHANGNVCSSNGYCDIEYNSCICKAGYVGIACEIKLDSATPCNGNGQQTKSFPLPSYDKDTDYEIPKELNINVKWL